ncbi:hypothetical protein KEJ32_00635 [Candidatus Bathyarchaeota archaeon]|nr:hypothetical protein [Candidatus Bathyarchaeota archaeon]
MDQDKSGLISDDEMIREACQIIEKANEEKIILRLLGAMGIVMTCSTVSKDCLETYKKLERLGGGTSMFTDIDFAAYAKQKKDIEKFFKNSLGFKPDMAINALFGNKRLMYYNTAKNYSVDIFLDKLEFCHDIPFVNPKGCGRLELFDYYIPPEDLLLEKLQIHDITYKDIVDIAMLLLTHKIGDSTSQGSLNGKYVANILCDDWGFWYDAMNNLRTVEKYINKFVEEKKFTREQAAVVLSNLASLINLIDATPKTNRWNKRAKDGTKKLWYRPVAEMEKRINV